MGAIDLSRHSTNPAKHYDGSRLAQGQVLSDDDFNDAAQMAQEELRRTRADVIGPAGTPDNGFALSAPAVVSGRCSFTIGAGFFYLGGLRLVLEKPELFHLQRDWLQQADADRPAPPAAAATRFDLVYLEAWQQPVTGIEDEELLEPAFGGAPPAPRLRTMRRVRVEADIGSDDCQAAWAAAAARWATLGSLTPEAELVADATLQVTYGGGGAPADLCSPGVTAGFLGAENQTIRVQLLPGNRLVWGFDNAARIYRVLARTIGGEADRREIEFLTLPRDAHSRPLAGQVVEILPWSAALANRVRADGTLDRPEKAAELAGHLAVVGSSFNPSTNVLTLAAGDGIPGSGAAAGSFGAGWKARADAAEIAGGGDEYLFLRVWDQGDGAGAKSTAFVPGTPVALGATGLSVTLRGTQFPPHLHWILSARPETADQVLPWQFDSNAGRLPQGVRRFRTPLGILRWTGGAGQLVDDCRPAFLPLTRIGSCCRVTVGDGSTSFGHFTSINAAIAALPPGGGEICVLAGRYRENVDLRARDDVTIHGCGERTIVESVQAPDGSGLGPVFNVTAAKRITLRDMAVIGHGMQPGILAAFTGRPGEDLRCEDLTLVAGPRCAVEIAEGLRVTLLRCRVMMRDLPGPWPGVFCAADDAHIEHCHIRAEGTPVFVAVAPPQQPTRARGGLQIGGGSERVRIIDNVIEDGIGNGITLGSLIETAGPNAGGIVFWFIDPKDPCDPCKPADIVVIVLPDPTGKPGLASAGDITDILIERNRIERMGLNGIGPVGFFDLSQVPILIGVHDARIIGNRIRGCLAREIAQTAAAVQWFAGYGAIALAECRRLLIADNDLTGNGPRHLDPVCGVFVLLGTSIEITRNRIEENGRRTREPSVAARPGNRSGIHIGLALPEILEVQPPEEMAGFAAKAGFPLDRMRRIQGVNALTVRENTVTQPLGRSLTAIAIGHVAVTDNTLTSRGQPGRDLSYRLVPNILLLGLGASSELGLRPYLGLLEQAFAWLSGKPAFDPAWLKQMCGYLSNPPQPELLPGHFVPASKVMFTDNRCALDLMAEPAGLFGSAILVAGMDDVGFGANQCEADIPLQAGLSGAFVAGMSARVNDNRFAETRRRVVFSAVTGGLMNTTTANQGTHCLQVTGPVPGGIVKSGNRAMLEVFCGPVCNHNG